MDTEGPSPEKIRLCLDDSPRLQTGEPELRLLDRAEPLLIVQATSRAHPRTWFRTG